MNEIRMIPIGDLEHHPENPRKDLGDLTELVESRVSPTIVVSRVLLSNVLRLPKSSVRNEEGRYYVYLSEDGQLHRRDVQIGLDGIDPATGAGYVQIVDGLNEGDMVQLR